MIRNDEANTSQTVPDDIIPAFFFLSWNSKQEFIDLNENINVVKLRLIERERRL